MRGDSRRCLRWADNSSGCGQDSDHAGKVSDDDDDDDGDDTDHDDRPGTEEAGASTLQMWRIVAREAGVKGNTQITRPEKYTHTLYLIKSGLFAGLVPRVTWISIGGAVFFGVYEKVSRVAIRDYCPM